MPPPTPRVFIIRHGETEWSLNGRHTGTSDIPLTANGEKRILATGEALVGDDRLIAPKNLAHVFVSPRKRARRSLELLMEGTRDWERKREKVTVAEGVAEWDYGEYEGKTSGEIGEVGYLEGWVSWGRVCVAFSWLPGFECYVVLDRLMANRSPEQVSQRLDSFIDDIRIRFHKPALDIVADGKGEKCPPCDVLVVAHGHILRALAARWIGKSLQDNPSLLMEAGGVGTLSYEHHSISEPAILLGGAFVVDVVESVEKEEEEKLRQAREGVS